MGELPKKFPEYAIMYKTLSNQIKTLEKRKENAQEKERDEIELKIQNYHLKLSKIKKTFPENFFDEN
ncbi:hypothetical protein [Nitrosopumilus ureiphilus]|uniref:Uncharacterized protein n=1 Tax=Nitrosopumilus ureiphilus TaxID=1470067 RepID=A0A7D5M536_9ARCH|nr:hypothetical protein [Nitrosopumilus ureiphilus]QLH06635.1 hypothetical protein C5F50_05775 [Nitrosopumilus ureiphilus]